MKIWNTKVRDILGNNYRVQHVLRIPWNVQYDHFTIDVKGLLELDTSKPITKELYYNQLVPAINGNPLRNRAWEIQLDPNCGSIVQASDTQQTSYKKNQCRNSFNHLQVVEWTLVSVKPTSEQWTHEGSRDWSAEMKRTQSRK
ncbi:hypothetical protein NPIL_624491 [Nephila pilipes]|uniref:Uncharacterized protein n=1 Tax=Nephila pilipes TaxID=299642 RepID=A0A8X6N9A8_NEPPI|nr:hypothetical protein NPIL_624491 [Nephila pilipes]